jgi:hypothetical protein
MMFLVIGVFVLSNTQAHRGDLDTFSQTGLQHPGYGHVAEEV